MADDFQSLAQNLDGPARSGLAVDVSSVDASLTHVTRAVWVGTSGDLKVDMEDSGSGIVIPSAAGWMPVRVTKIYHTGTTAAGIVAFW